MSTKTFSTYGDLTSEIADAICDRVSGARFGKSGRSISAYAAVDDAEGNECKARISDHDATASCDGRIVAELLIADLYVKEVNDDCGEFQHIETNHWWVAEEFIAAAAAKLNAITAEAEVEE